MSYDYYAILNTSRKSSLDEIRKSYRELALKSHPKRANYPKHPAILPEPIEKFVEHLPTLSVDKFWSLLGEAYDVLSNELRRYIYDCYGNDGLRNGIHTAHIHITPYEYHGDAMKTFHEAMVICSPYADSYDAASIRNNSSSLIHNSFKGPAIKYKCKDINKLLYVSVRDIYFGAMKKVEILRHEFIDEDRTRTAVASKILSIPIPKGCYAGTKIRFPNEGDRSADTIPADVVFTIADKADDTYKRNGSDLYLMHRIELWQALRGFKISLKTIDERKINIAIHDIVDAEYEKMIPNEGLPCPDDETQRGNLYIKFRIVFPKNVDVLLQQLNLNKWMIRILHYVSHFCLLEND